MKKLFYIIIVLCFVCSLCACSREPASTPLPGISGNSSTALPENSENAAFGETPEPTDGLEGSYFNDYLGLLLTMDGYGSYEMTGSDTHSGSYSRDGQVLVFSSAGRELHATLDEDGDILFEGMTGYFLSDWDKWDIRAEDTVS